jgi:hypothetical protein
MSESTRTGRNDPLESPAAESKVAGLDRSFAMASGQPGQAGHRSADRAGEKTRLRRMQYQPGLLGGFLAKTRLDFTPLR